MTRIRSSSLVALSVLSSLPASAQLDFNRDVRPILFDHCVACHGPDGAERKAGLRLDTAAGATALLESGARALIPGDPEASELIRRVVHSDSDERMPPAKHAKPLAKDEVATLRRWIGEGGDYARHWSYEPPRRPVSPKVSDTDWPRNPIDRFVLARLEREGLAPSAEAARHVLWRRVSLDLVGLPPSPEDLRRFPDYEAFVDHLLAQPTFGERWAAHWLDLARYADSAGYADDPPRTIWAYRDWVIRAYNRNQSFDRFTIEQIAGDLLPEATTEQLTATAFHRNTLTNSEGGTNDEEFRNAAVVDRVNTTMAVWMGTTMNCAQCHTHKYDPITQEEYFRLFAIFNNTEDADRKDERPTIPFFSAEQERRRDAISREIEELESDPPPGAEEIADARAAWEQTFAEPVAWSEAAVEARGDERVLSPAAPIFAVRAPGAGVELRTLGEGAQAPEARYVRVDLPEQNQFLHLAEVQVFRGDKNLAPGGRASQSSTAFGGPAKYGNDGNTDGDHNRKSVTHTAQERTPWWEVDLGAAREIDAVVVWNRTDGNVGARTRNYRVQLLNAERDVVWETRSAEEPKPSRRHETGGPGRIPAVVKEIGGETWIWPEEPVAEPVVLRGAAGARASTAPSARRGMDLPDDVFAAVRTAPAKRSDAQRKRLEAYLADGLPEVRARRARIAELRKRLDAIKPATTVPVLRERVSNRRRTRIQIRGDFMVTGKEVAEGLPSAFHPLPAGASTNRLGLATWLVSRDNPLTARVAVNRYWEALFGTGLVETSEEFGAQGEPPSHPSLLDWLAVEFMDSGWDRKRMLRLIVTSATYRQSSRATDALLARDPFNRLFTRGPSTRLSAEMVRDQALFLGALLSDRMHGPPARPPRPKLGLRAAFGGSTDWKNSEGEDRYRRGVYTEWRRSMPYPSMATFDAPNREVCTLRRSRTNTPLQALVTLNDPVYIEAAQALGRRLAAGEGTLEQRLSRGIELCLLRGPRPGEVEALAGLHREAAEDFGNDPEGAKSFATQPLGPLPEGRGAAEMAAWTLVGNVLLNLDETLQKQ